MCFIATAWPYDPVELTEAIIAEVQETGQSRTRFVLPLPSPSFSPRYHWHIEPNLRTTSRLSSLSDWPANQNSRSYVQRLSPLSFSCHSLSVDQVELQSARLVEQTFTNWATANNKTSITVSTLFALPGDPVSVLFHP